MLQRWKFDDHVATACRPLQFDEFSAARYEIRLVALKRRLCGRNVFAVALRCVDVDACDPVSLAMVFLLVEISVVGGPERRQHLVENGAGRSLRIGRLDDWPRDDEMA